MGDADADNYNEPFRAPSNWWEDLNLVVRNLLITAGSDEVLVDDIKAFSNKIDVRTSQAAAYAQGPN